jgi:hypothetical protein
METDDSIDLRAQRPAKQLYLRNVIIEQGYNAEEFTEFC